MIHYQNSLDFARQLDRQDPLKEWRKKFYIPFRENGEEVIYFCGNSLGLQPKSALDYLRQEMKDWQERGVEGHLHAKNPWYYYHHFVEEQTARLLGAKPIEVVVMNALTVNLNLMMVSFYRPDKKRYKVLMEAKAFPSDQYAVESHVRYHGLDPDNAIIEVMPEEGEQYVREEKIIEAIHLHKQELALVLLGGVNYYSGQFFDMEAITQAAHNAGALAAFDLAHAIGNVPLELHEWGVDFAVWCSYKYLNAGPGGVSGIFVHERHANSPDIPRFAGWWGNNEKDRFQMKKGFIPQPGAAGWQISNAPVLPMAVYKSSLEIFDKVGMYNLRQKSLKLTAFLEFLIKEEHATEINIITPEDPEQRGSQLSLLTGPNGKEIFDYLTEAGIVADWREPNVIRLAPVPLYNTFEEVYSFSEALKEAVRKLENISDKAE